MTTSLYMYIHFIGQPHFVNISVVYILVKQYYSFHELLVILIEMCVN